MVVFSRIERRPRFLHLVHQGVSLGGHFQ
jgi:hypothetical protein